MPKVEDKVYTHVECKLRALITCVNNEYCNHQPLDVHVMS